MKKLIYIAIAACFAYMVFQTSCANTGMPTGGEKDSIPPEVLRIKPLPNQTNYSEQLVIMTFDEFVVSTDVPSQMLVSPPLPKRPRVKMRSKTLTIDFGNQLKENTSYSIDFRRSIKDNNEGNPMEDFRIAFSTGELLDTLEIGGYVKMANNLEPMEDILVALYRTDSLHYFKDSIPNYIAKTDEEGFFLLSNIANGNYRVYALQDADNSLTFNSTEELVGFVDSVIAPDVPLQVIQRSDSVLANILNTQSIDSIAEQITLRELKKAKEKKRIAEPYYIYMYQEFEFNQYLNNSKRSRANLCEFYFDESLSDSFEINLIHPAKLTSNEFSLLQYSQKKDSLMVWITDTIIAKSDTLEFALRYTVLDSLKQASLFSDTLKLSFEKREKPKRKKKDDEEEEKVEIPHFSISSNANSPFDINSRLHINTPEPLINFDYSLIHLYKIENDTIEVPLEFTIVPDSINITKYHIDYEWEFSESYNLYIDSAAATSISHMPSNAFSSKIKVQDLEHYASIALNLEGVNSPTLVQICKSNEEETIIQSKSLYESSELVFSLLPPDKFIIKIVLDHNDNKKWDAGNIKEGILPEHVLYYPKIIKLRSNFDVKESWTLPSNVNQDKSLVDQDEEEKAKYTK